MANDDVSEALRIVKAVVGEDRLVVIGATVITILIDMRHGLADGRVTRDLDAVVKASSWQEFESIRKLLVAEGFKRGREPHRLYFNRSEIDLIPYSPELVEASKLRWPDDTEMSALGLEEAFDCAQPATVEDVLVPMVSVAGSILLKFVAYSDRPSERRRDIEDILHTFRHYGAPPDDSIRFDIAGLDLHVDNAPVTFEEAGAYVLGTQVKKLAKPDSLSVVKAAVLSLLNGEFASDIDEPVVQFDRRLLCVFHFGVVSEPR